MASIFLSHSHEDNRFARRLAHDLITAGVTVWLDEAELGPGDSVIEKIGQAIDATDYLGVLLSRHSVQSEWVRREVEIALTQEIAGRIVKVVPILVDNCEIPPFLRARIYADFREPANYEAQLSRLINALGGSACTASGRATVIFDESYNQERWYGKPLVSAGYSTIAELVATDYTVRTNTDGYSSCAAIPPRAILIMPTPFGTLVDDREYEEITRWVNRGGRLVLFGTYLMEAHHYNNFNRLSRRLGFEFTHHLTMPRGHEDFQECLEQAVKCAQRAYWVQTALIGQPPLSPLLDGVQRVAFTSSCTIESAIQPDITVATAEEVALLHGLIYKEPGGGRLLLRDYVLDKYASVPILIAQKYGMGRVVAIATWKIFINDLVADNNDNLQLFQNVIAWLATDNSPPSDSEPAGA